SVQAGRLGANPFVSLGYLDGALGQARLGRHHHLGGLAGAAAEIDDLGFESEGTKYGAFYRFDTAGAPGTAVADLTVAAITEEADSEVSRDYVSLETRVRGGGGRWHLFQRAEVDLNRDWRQEVTGRSSQLTNLSLSTSYQISPGVRWVASYDQFRPYRDADTRHTPEEVFQDFLRQGFRTGVYLNGRRLAGSLLVGVRDREGDLDPTTSFSGTLRYSFAQRLYVLARASTFDGDATDGFYGSIDLRRAFRGGHDVGLTYGYTGSTVKRTSEDRSHDWVRLSGRVELPARLFASAEIETLSGDDQEGTYLYLDLGYRF
ncbi:MAG: hypothetical protein R3190_16635, partial [Thermoanaerobaculia bacterium]|nr:hypothetical protein [Thermoanaerobaculia bacterium]